MNKEINKGIKEKASESSDPAQSTFRIKLVSSPHIILFVIILIATVVIWFGFLVPDENLGNMRLAILHVGILAVAALALWQILVTGRSQWTVNHETIQVVWTRKFLGHHGNPVVIKWSEIESITRGADPNYYTLKINLQSGQTLKFFHDNLTLRDDFEALLKDLNQHLTRRGLAMVRL